MGEVYKLTDDWGKLQDEDKIVVYGVGRIGRRVIPTLMKEFDIPYLIDNWENNKQVLGLSVVGRDEAINLWKKNSIKIVVTTVLATYKDIVKELEFNGLQEYKDFCHFERFASEWNLRWRNRCVLSKIDTVITSRCTLKCQNCNMFIGHAMASEDMSLESLKRNFDVFFKSVDFVYEYTLLGGEPFLHTCLVDIITYLGETYGARIGLINIISNGTIVPDEEVVNILKKYGVTVHISDYTCSVPYEKKIRMLVKNLTESGINHYVIPNNVWKDVVYPDMTYSCYNPKRHMILCGHSTHSVNNGKIYWCDPAFAAEYFTGFKGKNDDSLDLESNRKNNSQYEASLNVLRYILGDVNERGYMSFCEKCAGVGSDNDRVVKAGVQMKG